MIAAKKDQSAPAQRPYLVALGGSLNAHSSTQKAMALALSLAAEAGWDTCLLTGEALDLPFYMPDVSGNNVKAKHLTEQLRRADGLIIGSPVYHGSLSGVVKNAVDYAEDLRTDIRPYFSERPVGIIATGGGWQGCVSTMGTLRDIVHALRGWNTPFSVPINTCEPVFDRDGRCLDEKTHAQIVLLVQQITEFVGVKPPSTLAA